MHCLTHPVFDTVGRHVSQLSVIELSIVRSNYLPPVVPPCRVCGADLEVVAIGAGHVTKYACSSIQARRSALSHYHDSEFRVTDHGDPRVVAAIDELLAYRAGAGEPVEIPVGTVHVDGIESMPLVYHGDGRWEREISPASRFAATGG